MHSFKNLVVAIPDDYARRLKLHVTKDKPDRVKIPEKPNICYCTEFIVAKSDYDCQNHVNRSVYIRYCLNAIHSAFSSKHFTSSARDFDDYDVRQIESIYVKEISDCQKITVYVWKAQNNDSFHCQIEDAAGNTCYKATVAYNLAGTHNF